jgi:tetratricopeptide (TPR) repeat protein
MLRETAPRLVGRDREVAAVASALARVVDDDVRGASIVTVVGPVGVGKTALARRVAAELRERGVFDAFVLLDASAEGSIASAASLVILDGCDGNEAARLLERVRAAEPTATLLATARAPLGLEGEIVVELGPLATPAGDEPTSPAFDCLLSRLPEGSHEALSRDGAAVAALLRELDGLPLAIVLAAPRLALMDPRALLHRLQQSRSILERPGASPTERKPFEAALAGAIQALSPQAQAGLAALTSIATSASIEALEAIVSPPAGPSYSRSIDIVDELRMRALLVPAPGASTSRLTMLRCVRDVVLRNANPNDRDGGLERHAAYYADLAEALRRRAAQGDADGARRAVEDDRDNFVTVLERIVKSPVLGAAAVQRALRVLVSVYAVPGAMPPAAFLSIIDAAVDRTKDSGADPSLVAQALVVRARARRAGGDDKGATRDLLRALPIAASMRRRDVEADATAELAHLLAAAGQLEAGVDHARRASLAYREAGDRIHEAVAAARAGDLERRRGRIDDARAAIERALPLAGAAPSAGSQDVIAAALRLFLETRDDKALHGTIALARTNPAAPAGQEAALLLVEGVALHDRGETTAARERYLAADGQARRTGARRLEAEIALFDALAALGLGSWGNALARLRSAADLEGRGWMAGEIAELARTLAFAIDAMKNPAWRGSAPPVRRSNYARALVAAAEAGAFDHYGATPPDDGEDRVVARLLAGAIAAQSGTPARAESAPDAATFDLDGRWFRLPAEPTVTLEKRRPIAAMLKLLVAERLARPGASISVEQLLAAGWPGERVLPDAGAHRVRVALSTLRKLGLKSVLVTTPTGYVLDPEQKVVTANEAPG